MDTAISVKNLGKSFKMFASPKERLKELLHPFNKKYHKEFWALRNVSFQVRKGETLGIVGKNGSGKSTLLQVLCGILRPTEGEVVAKGRISALLELGAGFNPQFTGRENVYMNGAIMGLKREEVEERYDEIVAFADIGDFIDQPARTYSSGMYIRLAFACAVNVDPDILIVDEALAVGDEAFQRKCFSRLMAFKKLGGTILFVSHASNKVVELCDHAILLDQGELLVAGRPKAVVSIYHRFLNAPKDEAGPLREEIRASTGMPDDSASAGTGPPETDEEEEEPRAYYDPGLVPKSTVLYESRGALIENPRITTLEGERVNVLVRGEDYIYTYDVKFTEPAFDVRFGMTIKTTSGFELGGMASSTLAETIDFVEKDTVQHPQIRFRCSLFSGGYFLNSGVAGTVDGAEVFLHRGVDIAMFRVQPETDGLQYGVVDFSIPIKSA